MKKVLFGYIMNGKAGGIDKYMLNFFEHFSPGEVHFDFLTTQIDNELKEKLESKGAGLFEIPTLKNPRAQYKAICDIIKKNGYDTAYFNISTAICYPGPKAAHDCGVKKVIIHSHSAWYDCSNPKKRALMIKLNNLCRNFLYKYGTDFYACSALAGKWIFPEKIVGSDKFKLVKNGIDLATFTYSPEKREAMREKLQLQDKFVIGSVGNFLYPKNHDFMVRVFSELCKIDSDARLLLVGDGLLFDNVKEQVKSLGLADKVIFSGRQTDAYNYMMAMDIYLMPSHFEGFGIAAVEAEATGLMCCLSDHIPSDAVITENCVTLSIDKDGDAKVWAEKIEKAKGYKRIDRTDEVRRAGYDLSAQNFYELV